MTGDRDPFETAGLFVLMDRNLGPSGYLNHLEARRVGIHPHRSDASSGPAVGAASSLRGVFAAGDVRRGAIKRVAFAVGEGAAVINEVHQDLAELHRPHDSRIAARWVDGLRAARIRSDEGRRFGCTANGTDLRLVVHRHVRHEHPGPPPVRAWTRRELDRRALHPRRRVGDEPEDRRDPRVRRDRHQRRTAVVLYPW